MSELESLAASGAVPARPAPSPEAALATLSLDVPPGEVVMLVGPSGCGKTTTLKMINRLIEPSGGRILLDGADVTRGNPVRLRRRIGYVIQNVGLFPHRTIAENIGTVPRLVQWDRRRVAARVNELLDLVGLDPAVFARRYPSQLSGGQRQRIGVARALAADPVVLLMDEPFSAVDPIARARLQDEFRRLQDTVRKTILLVTHDLDEAVRLGDRIAVLAQHGRLQQYDPPARLLAEPANDFVREFVGTDRAIRRLGVTPIPRDILRPLSDMDAADEAVPAGATLEDALAALLASGNGRVVVTDGDRRLGVLTPDDIYRALHETAQST